MTSAMADLAISRRQSFVQGPLWIFASALLFSLMNLGVRLDQGTFRPDVLVFYRGVLQVLVLVKGVTLYLRPPLRERLRSHFWRGTFGCLSMFLLYASVQRLPLAFATLLTMTSVFWSGVLARLLLGERIGLFRGLSGLCVCLGIALSLFDPNAWFQTGVSTIGVLCALGCGFASGMAFTALRKMRQGMGTREIVFFFGLTLLLCTAPSFFVRPQFPQSWSELGRLLWIAGAGAAGQLCLSHGFRHTTAWVASVCNVQQVLINVCLGAWILHEMPGPHFLFATAIVLLGLLGMSKRPRLT